MAIVQGQSTLSSSPEGELVIYHLEDAEFSTIRVQEKVEQRFKSVRVKWFGTPSELELQWEKGYRPAAVIIDLMVPERYVWIAHALFGKRKTGKLQTLWQSLKKVLAYAVVSITGLNRTYLPRLRTIFDAEKKRLEEYEKLKESCVNVSNEIVKGQSTYWGGIEFLRNRLLQKDQDQSQFYIYSLAVNQQYIKSAKADRATRLFGEICGVVKSYVEETLETNLRLEAYAKGFIKWENDTPGLDEQSDEFDKLLEQLAADLKLNGEP